MANILPIRGNFMILIGSDHGGFDLKEKIKKFLIGEKVEFEDIGTKINESVDYPDYGIKVARAVSEGKAERGILVCGTGIGMSIVTNKFAKIRATLCSDTYSAKMSREHNDSNILILGGRIIEDEKALEIVKIWLETPFEGGRHKRRLDKIDELEKKLLHAESGPAKKLAEIDPDIAEAIRKETERQEFKLELIASENFVSEAVLEAQGCIMTNKYAEGYPKKRYYGGCEFVDIAEELAIERAKKLFGAGFVNVQPHSGSQANMAVYFSICKPGDTILGMNLSHGGHLTHGSPVNFSGTLYKVVFYGVNKETETIDYDEVRALAKEHKPKLIVVGASAYPRKIDFQAFRKIADEADAAIMADIAHYAGLVTASLFPNPLPYCEFVTTTTHKTLRGPRGGMIMTNNEELAKLVNKNIFPGMQGGPLMHIIAAKAVAFKEALTDEFKNYQRQIVKNAAALAETLKKAGFRLVSGGTDTHLMLVNLTDKNITGKEAEEALDKSGMTVNKNTIPFETRSPFITSGIRIGTPALTTRGMKEKEMELIGSFIVRVLKNVKDEECFKKVKEEVRELCLKFPFYSHRM